MPKYKQSRIVALWLLPHMVDEYVYYITGMQGDELPHLKCNAN